MFGTNGKAKLLMEDRDGRPLDIALIEIRDDQVWIMRAEPTLEDRVGITISNSAGKVLFVGMGDLIVVNFIPLKPELKPKKGHVLTLFFHEVYIWRSSAATAGA